MKKEKQRKQVQVKENKISIHDKIMSIKDDVLNLKSKKAKSKVAKKLTEKAKNIKEKVKKIEINDYETLIILDCDYSYDKGAEVLKEERNKDSEDSFF